MFTYQGQEHDILRDFTALYKKAGNLVKSFELQEQQDILNLLPVELKHYSKRSFIKMWNLYYATHKLSSGDLALPNEAKCIVRSMIEHCFNFSYIMYSSAEGEQIEEEQIEKIKRFFKYQEDIAPFDNIYKLRISLSKKTSKNSNEVELFNKLNDCITEYSVEQKREEYSNKYGKNLSHWSGKNSFKEMARSLEIDIFFWIYRIYEQYCAEVHSVNLADYLNDDGVYCSSVETKNTIEVCFFCNKFFQVFLLVFFKIFDLDQADLKLYEDEFDRIKKQYQMKFS